MTSSDLRLVLLTNEHLPVFARMVAQLYIDDPSSTVMTLERATAQAERMLREPSLASPLLVTAGKDVVGYVVLVPFFSNEYGGIVGVVDELFVRAEQRSRGYGTAILGVLKSWAAERGYVLLELEVNAANTRARALYERQGFVAHTRTLMHAKV